MNFCPDCRRTLSLKIKVDAKTSNQYLEQFCKNCNYKIKLDSKKDKCIVKNEYNLQKLQILDKKQLQNIVNDPTIPHINNMPCVNNDCPSKQEAETLEDTDKNRNLVVYIKIDDNDMKYMYICAHCLTTWTNN